MEETKYKVGDFVLFNPAMKPSLNAVDHPMVITGIAQVWAVGGKNKTYVQYYDAEWRTINNTTGIVNLPEHFLIPDVERSRKSKIGKFLKDNQ